MGKFVIGLVLAAAVIGACSSAAERDSFALQEDDAGVPLASDDGDAASGPDGDDGSDLGSADASDVDVNVIDASDAALSVCTGDPPPTQTSDDCYATQPCVDCGDNSFIYRCGGKTTTSVPTAANCSRTSISGDVCCQATCVRTALSDQMCNSTFSKAWQCANVNASNNPLSYVYGCSHLKTNGMTVTMCCQPTVVPEWQ